jgi:repressor LexA
MKTLSDRQQRILSFIHDFLEEKDYPPTIRDILKACQISSTSVVDYNLDVLKREGYIRRDAEVSRGIELQDRRRRRERLVPVPVIGRIAAGEPIPVPAPDNWSMLAAAEVVELSQELTRGQEKVYALRVKGTSLVDALIDDGDIVLMQYVTAAENGELVAVWLKAEGEVTLKRFYREPGRIRLQPANSQMQPIYAEPANVEVQGKVIAVVRQLG